MSHLIVILSQSISSWGYLAIFVLMLLDNLAIPFPSEVTLAFGGYLASQHKLGLAGVVIWGTVGSIIGSLLLYWIGLYGGREFIKKHGKKFFIKHEHLERTEKFFIKYGNASNFFGRLLPVIRTYISLPAGFVATPIKSFTFYAGLGSLIWAIIISYIGFKLGNNWQNLLHYTSQYNYLAIAVIIVLVVYLISKRSKSLT